VTGGKPALLATADGAVFRGRSVGADGVTTGEAVFNTSMTGYQEILTDPSYAGQIVVMTVSHVGNYGVTEVDAQSSGPAVSGFVMRSLSRREWSPRSEGDLGDYLRDNGVVALTDIDTRRLTRRLRDRGAMPAAMGAGVTEAELVAAAAEAPSMKGRDLVSAVTTAEPYRADAVGERRGLVAVIDLGVKRDIITSLTARGLDVVVMPASAGADEIGGLSPDGVLVSNGPGDPEPLRAATDTVRALLGEHPVFGICLGHQVLGLAAGARTYKLPFGHHGGNHPVRRMGDGGVEITAQNHGFAVDLWSLADGPPPERDGPVGPALLPESVDTELGAVRPTRQNLNDGTLEGMTFEDVPAFSIQYHPEAAPGPNDAAPVFDRFVELIEESR